MKKQSLFFLLLIVSSTLYAQLKVNTSGYIEIGTNPSTNQQLNVKGNSFFDGLVGIGTTPNLSYKLNLAGNSHLAGYSYLDGYVGIGVLPTTTYKLNLSGSSYFNGLVGIGTPPNTNYKLNVLGNSNFSGGNIALSGDLNITGTSQGGPTLYVTSSSQHTPCAAFAGSSSFIGPYVLWVSGDAYSTGIWESSDNQLKKRVTVLDGKLMLSKILKIDGKKYEFKNNEELELVSLVSG